MIVLDTHVWLWWINQDTQRLKPEWLARLEGPEDVGVSAISCFEVAWLERHGRIALPCPHEVWFEKALAGSGIALLPLSPRIASLAVDLPEHHTDPQDRIIIATAWERDQQRTLFLESLGLRVLRFENRDVLWDLAGVLAQIRACFGTSP